MKKIFSVFSLVLPSLAYAHPGHGDHGGSGFTITHYFTEPDHALGALLGLAILGFGIYKLISKKDSQKSNNA